MARCDLQIVIEPSWWLCLYIYGVALMCHLTGAEPNWSRFCWWAAHGYRAYLLVGDERVRLELRVE